MLKSDHENMKDHATRTSYDRLPSNFKLMGSLRNDKKKIGKNLKKSTRTIDNRNSEAGQSAQVFLLTSNQLLGHLYIESN